MLADELGRLGIPVYLYGELGGGRTRAELRRPGGLDDLDARLRPADATPRPARRSSPRARRWSRSTSRSTRRSSTAKAIARHLRERRSTSARSASSSPTRVQVSTNIEDHTRVTAARSGRGGPRARARHRRRARRARPARRARGLPRRRAAPGPETARRSSTLVGAMAQTKRKRRTQAPRQRRGLDRGTRPHRPQAHRGGAEDGRPPDRARPPDAKPPSWNSAALKALRDGRAAVRPHAGRHPRQRRRASSRASSWPRWRW